MLPVSQSMLHFLPQDVPQSMPQPKDVLCSVCIASYRRPDLLAKLIDSLLNQQLDARTSLEIIVVDNDGAQSAKPVIDAYQNPTYPIRYAVEPRKNISHARNKGVRLAQGDYILFIDDDETAPENWVMNLLTALHAHSADGVFGRVLPDFHADTPEWMTGIYLFNRESPATGTLAKRTSTANCLIKAELLKNEQGPFDEAFGITGGEDTHLFTQLKSKDAHFIYSREGWVSEYIPPDRTTTDWMLKRALRTGNLYGHQKVEHGQHKMLARLKNIAIGLSYTLVALVLALFYFPNKAKRWHWLLKAGSKFGQFLSVFNVRIDGY